MSEQLGLQLLGTLWAITLLLIGVVYRLIMTRIEKLETKAEAARTKSEDLGKEVGEVRSNYIDRFAEVNKNMADMKDAIIKEIHSMQVHCASVHSLISNQGKV